MVTWAIRAVLALAIATLAALAIASRAPAPPPAVAEPEATVPPPVVQQVQPTATSERFVERIISRVARATPEPYPTSTPLPANLALVNVVDFGYMPSVIRIHVGQAVVWKNGGRELHDVTGDDDWHSGPIEPETEYRHTFGFEGTWTYRCSVHPDMIGSVVVST